MKWKCGFLGMVFLFNLGYGMSREESEFQRFLQNRVGQIAPLLKEANLAYWNAAVTGNESDYARYGEYELKIRTLFSNSEDFHRLKTWKASRQIQDPLLSRQLDLLFLAYLPNQIPPDLLKSIVELSTQLENRFSTFRGQIDGIFVTANQIDSILKTEKDPLRRKSAWLASKQVGEAIASDLVRLVKLRNQAAQRLGFKNYHALSLFASEQNSEEIEALFNTLRNLTEAPFRKAKGELDSILAQPFGISPKELMPWHYHDPFFQEVPQVLEVNFDPYYASTDITTLAVQFFEGVGLPVNSILDRSDLYEKPGKNPHAFCTHIDREGDVRILCNLKNTERWMGTLLHELGHAVYEVHLDFTLPFLLREPAHAFVTEGIAMFFERLSQDAEWMKDMLGLSPETYQTIEKPSARYLRFQHLIFARWAMVMFAFEKALYENPDQDLNALWWDLVEAYQGLQKPPDRNAPDWASKIHFVIAPCYYHNYLLGELFASQLHHEIRMQVLGREGTSYVHCQKVGEFLKTRIFQHGTRYKWNSLIQIATEEPLNPTYFVEECIEK